MSSRAYRLKSEEGVAEGLRRIASGRAEEAVERLAGADDESPATAIHGARKDLKKLRAVLRLLRRELGRDTFRAENRAYREAGRLLSRSRDAEVKLTTLRALRDRAGDELPIQTALFWERVLEREREEIAGGGAKLDEATRLIEQGRDRIAGWELRADGWKLLKPGLTRIYRNGRQAMSRALAEPSVENVHRWRKRAKDHWYELRILREAWPSLLEATIAQAHELTELLGEHHDLALLGEDLRARGGLGEREPIEAAIAKRQEELFEAAVALGRRLYAEKPKAFQRRLGRYWLVWRDA
jgi:CHAD domain-containing protein